MTTKRAETALLFLVHHVRSSFLQFPAEGNCKLEFSGKLKTAISPGECKQPCANIAFQCGYVAASVVKPLWH
jgi:hypothetical protein